VNPAIPQRPAINPELVAEIQQHQRTREQLHTVLDAVPGLISWLDADLCYLGVNQQLADLCHLSAAQFIGRPLGFLNPRGNQFVEFVRSFFASGKVFDRQEISRESHTFLTIAQKYNQGEAAVVIQIDITDRKAIEAKLELANQQLAHTNIELAQTTSLKDEMLINMANIHAELVRATKLKDDFLANMSHELRTPLNAILGLSEALSEDLCGPLNPRQHKAITTISQSGNHLLALINDILDLSKIEAGSTTLNQGNLDPQHMITSTIEFVKYLASQKNITIRSHVHPDITSIYVDQLRFQQALINLMSNAVKFTPNDGTITINVFPNNNHSSVFISVQDTGIGIAAADLDQLFKPFVQIDSKLNRQYSGTGLGLALARRIIELHQGQINVVSQVGQGSTFTIVIPWPQSPQCNQGSQPLAETRILSQPPQEATIANPVGKRILLADDNMLNIALFSEYLEDQGYTVVQAKNGREALTIADSTTFDLIIMDIQMPHVDGITAIRSLRENVRYQDFPIIALTALAMPGDKERCLRAGATEYITKPVQLKHLGQRIQHWLTPVPTVPTLVN
jgi:signal transduction histidine kinase/ActR/RegA family two-component response regulator